MSADISGGGVVGEVSCGADTPSGPCVLPPHSRGYHDSSPPTLTVPRDSQGRPKVSISQLRRYGAVDLATGGEDHTETIRGCPRSYALTYGTGQPVPEFPSRPAELGILLHRALAYMEDHTCGPEEALGAVWPPTLGPADMAEAQRILGKYIERGGPGTRYATLAAELDLTMELYVDDLYGPVMFRGIVDVLAVDPSDPGVVQVIDYKSAARPISKESLRGNVQLMGYVWLVRQWWFQQHGYYPERVIAHFDALRYSDVPIEYTASELDLWWEWACAMCRTMLRDENPQPILNDGCTWCPVKWTCPAWLALPGEGMSALARLQGSTPENLGDRLIEAQQVLKLLAHHVEERQKALEAETVARGSLQVGDQTWEVVPGSKTVANVLSLVTLLLPHYPSAFEVAVTASKASVERAAQGLDPSLGADVVACVGMVEAGTRISKKKRKKKVQP
ncbi:MAG: RecB family exonuclease [Candidatus Dormibacteria bacterium]